MKTRRFYSLFPLVMISFMAVLMLLPTIVMGQRPEASDPETFCQVLIYVYT